MKDLFTTRVVSIMKGFDIKKAIDHKKPNAKSNNAYPLGDLGCGEASEYNMLCDQDCC